MSEDSLLRVFYFLSKIKEKSEVEIINVIKKISDYWDELLEIKGAPMEELIDLLERNGLIEVKIEKLPGLTRPGFDYEPWFVLMGTKPFIH